MGDTTWMEDTSTPFVSSCPPFMRPDLSSCHRCGLHFPVNAIIDRFHILESQWRIVLLCYDCLDGVRSVKVCSYCFLGFSELEKEFLNCVICSCRVHRACVPLHHRNLWTSQFNLGKFMCMDCCPIQRFRGESVIKSGASTSHSGCRFTTEDLLQDEKSKAERKVIKEGKSVALRASTHNVEKESDAVHLDPTHINLPVSDAELALRLHRSVNGSQRISRSFFPKDEAQLTVARKVRGCNVSVGRVVDSNSCGNNDKIEVCSENVILFVNRESSQTAITGNIVERNNEDPSKKDSAHNIESPKKYILKGNEITLKASDSCSDDNNFSSALFLYNSLNSQLNSSVVPNKRRFGAGDGSSELCQKFIDTQSVDRCKKKYFRRRCRSKQFFGS